MPQVLLWGESYLEPCWMIWGETLGQFLGQPWGKPWMQTLDRKKSLKTNWDSNPGQIDDFH